MIFVRESAARMAKLKAVDSFSEETRVGLVVNDCRIAMMDRVILYAISRGAIVLAGGERVDNRGWS